MRFMFLFSFYIELYSKKILEGVMESFGSTQKRKAKKVEKGKADKKQKEDDEVPPRKLNEDLIE